MYLESPELSLGFLPLVDCAPLAVAHELGFFAAEGLKVSLSREASWATLRDKLCTGRFQGAQMLAPMPLAISLGLSSISCPLIVSFTLSLNGNAVTISNMLREQLRNLDPEALVSAPRSVLTLQRVVKRRRENDQAPLVFATVFPYSCQNYLLRYWLAAGGIDPDEDLNLVVIPPPQMAAQLAAGRIDGLCVGEPWNQVAARHGHVLFGTREIWQNAPEKVLALREDWAGLNPGTHQALLRALLRATTWLAEDRNAGETFALLAQPQYLDLPADLIAEGYRSGGHVFHRYCANYPWQSQALWLLSQMRRWSQLRADIELEAVAARIFRTDLYRQACQDLSLPCPQRDSKEEGLHAAPWQDDDVVLGPDRFLDGRSFDPSNIDAYLRGF